MNPRHARFDQFNGLLRGEFNSQFCLSLLVFSDGLKPGGEFYFSDVFADRRLPDEIAFDTVLHSECLGGAMYRPDFIRLAKDVGFPDPRVISEAPITIQNADIEKKVGAARFESVCLVPATLLGWC